jgi:microcystin-dependent protein
MADPFVAEIRIFPFNFPPKGWAFCNGQLMPLSQNTALFSLVGTYYGGDGKSTFGLPDLQGRAPMFWGQGPGLSLHDQGEQGGTETVTLAETELPSHSHPLGSGGTADTASPSNAAWAAATAVPNQKLYGDPASASGTMPGAFAGWGRPVPHNNLQPYLTLEFCIALQGVYPAR